MGAEIELWGRFARHTLSAPEGRVIAVFERSLYVETALGLACLGAVGGGPLSACCKPLSVNEGAVMRRFGAMLSIGQELIALERAREWEPGTGPVRLDLAAVSTSSPGGGLSRVAIALARDETPPQDDPLLRQAVPCIESLRRRDLEAAAPLLGLGPGLTPSGDDFIGGFLIVSRDRRVAEWALALAPERTNRISAAHLAAAAAGEAAAVFHDALGGGPLAPLLALGHSSGWDMLTGAIAALKSAR
jgi:Protein of unknown function (DUF2877)